MGGHAQNKESDLVRKHSWGGFRGLVGWMKPQLRFNSRQKKIDPLPRLHAYTSRVV